MSLDAAIEIGNAMADKRRNMLQWDSDTKEFISPHSCRCTKYLSSKRMVGEVHKSNAAEIYLRRV